MIDPSIIGRQNAFVQPDLLGNFTNALQAKALVDQQGTNALHQQAMQYQLQAAQRADARDVGLNEAYRGSIGPNGEIDQAKLLQTLATGGLGSAIPNVQKGLADSEKSRLEVTEKRLKNAGTMQDQHIADFMALTKDPSDERIVNMFKGAPPELQAQRDRLLAQPYAQRQEYLHSLVGSTERGAKSMELAAPKVQLADTGGALTPYNTNSYAPGGIGPMAGAAPITKTATIGETETAGHNRVTEGQGAQRLGIEGAQLGISRGNQSIAQGHLTLAQQAQQFAQAQAGGSALTKDANDVPGYLPKNLAPGAPPPTFIAATLPGGAPIPGKTAQSQTKQLNEINAQIATTDGALDTVKKNPDAFGIATGLPAAIGGTVGESVRASFAKPENNAARAEVFRSNAQLVHDLLGAAQSDAERKSVASFALAPTDTAAVITDKMNGLKRYMENQRSIYAAPPQRDSAKPDAPGKTIDFSSWK